MSRVSRWRILSPTNSTMLPYVLQDLLVVGLLVDDVKPWSLDVAIISSDGALLPICLRKFDDISKVLSVIF